MPALPPVELYHSGRGNGLIVTSIDIWDLTTLAAPGIKISVNVKMSACANNAFKTEEDRDQSISGSDETKSSYRTYSSDKLWYVSFVLLMWHANHHWRQVCLYKGMPHCIHLYEAYLSLMLPLKSSTSLWKINRFPDRSPILTNTCHSMGYLFTPPYKDEVITVLEVMNRDMSVDGISLFFTSSGIKRSR